MAIIELYFCEIAGGLVEDRNNERNFELGVIKFVTFGKIIPLPPENSTQEVISYVTDRKMPFLRSP